LAATDRNLLEIPVLTDCNCGCGRAANRKLRAGKHLPLLPVIALVFLPKCPLCLMAWFGILGSLEVSAWVFDIWGVPLIVGLLSSVICVLVLRGHRSRDFCPLLVGMLGAGIFLSSKYLFDAQIMIYAGSCLLIGALFWSSWLLGDLKKVDLN